MDQEKENKERNEEEVGEKKMEFSEDKFGKLIAKKGFQLSKRYYIHFTGTEDLQEINKKIADCSKKLQEINWILGELEDAYLTDKDALKEAEDQVDMKSSTDFIQMVAEAEKGGKKLTDKHASSKVLSTISQSEQFATLTSARAAHLLSRSRLLRWERLHKQINFIYDALKSTGIHYMSESKTIRGAQG